MPFKTASFSKCSYKQGAYQQGQGHVMPVPLKELPPPLLNFKTKLMLGWVWHLSATVYTSICIFWEQQNKLIHDSSTTKSSYHNILKN